VTIAKPIAIGFTLSALIILAASFTAPNTVAANSNGCTTAYGIDPCSTGSVAK
jgi:hypothetical protein